MAGGAAKYRHLSRKSSHRQALLRNLVTSLFKHESITTTWPKAKEAQRLAEKLITLGKKNTEASRRRALSIFYVCAPADPFCQFWSKSPRGRPGTSLAFGFPRLRDHRTASLEDFEKLLANFITRHPMKSFQNYLGPSVSATPNVLVVTHEFCGSSLRKMIKPLAPSSSLLTDRRICDLP